MRDGVGRAGWAAIAIFLCALPAVAVGESLKVQFAQNATDAGQATAEPGQPPLPAAPTALPANSPEQVRKAQTELQRLDCLRGRIDGKLGNQTRQAVKKFWTSANQPVREVTITDELISDLVDRGAGFCRPARRFFAIGMRPSGNSPLPPLLAPGARPIPGTPARPPAPATQR